MIINNTKIIQNQVFWRHSLGFCATPEKIENFNKVWEDQLNGVVFNQKWVIHHRREITEGKSKAQLIEEGNYYRVQPSELIYLLSSEHTRLHNLARNPFSGKQHTDEWKNNHSEKMRGKKNPFYGKHHTEEAKEKNRLAHIGKKMSEEARRKIGEATKRRWEKLRSSKNKSSRKDDVKRRVNKGCDD